MSAVDRFLPDYQVFQRVCATGLSAVRPLEASGAARDPDGWNFGTAWPPSYGAFGRMRALLAAREAIATHPVRVLEVAAGDAALVAQLATLGCEVVANDLRRDVLEASVACFTNASRISILPGNLFDLDPATTGRFDLVVACEVVEHIAHTVDFLRHLKRFVTAAGRILLTTPNGAYFRSKLPTYSEIRDFDALEQQQFKPDADGHLFLITPEEMRTLAGEAGLAVESVDLWALPTLTGHGGFRVLSGRAFCRLAYGLERSGQRLPYGVKRRLCNALSVVLTPR